MINDDLKFAEKIYGNAKMWYIFYDDKIEGPFDLFEAKKKRDSYMDVLDDMVVDILVNWRLLENECIKMFGE